MEKNENTKHLQHNNGNCDTSTSNCSTQITQIDGSTGIMHQSSATDTAESSGLLCKRPYGVNSIFEDRSFYYNMDHKYSGKAIILKNEIFDFDQKSIRSEIGLDCSNLETSLKKLGFDVKIYVDLTLEELYETVFNCANDDYTNHGCFLMAVLSQGNHYMMHAKDGVYEPDYDLWGQFTDDKCKTLINKPKIFVIQTYENYKPHDYCAMAIPLKPDFLIAQCLADGSFPWLNPEKGSWYIQALCNTLDRYGSQKDILSILTMANYQVSINYKSNIPIFIKIDQDKPVPYFLSSLTKLLKFKKNNK